MARKPPPSGPRGAALKAAGLGVLGTQAKANASERRGSAGGKIRASPATSKLQVSKNVSAAVCIQSWFRGHLGRCLALRYRMRIEQRRLEEKYEQEERARREAAANAKVEAEKAAKREKERQKEAGLRAYRERRGAAELMCQTLPSQTMPWEEDAGKLLALLETKSSATNTAESWLGRHSSRRDARKQYLLLARKWHPDKWARQGEQSVAVATDVTKCLVCAYEWMNKNLPPDDLRVHCNDADEEAEVYEFASFVGIAFEGMFEVWKERRGVTRGS